MFSSRLAWGLEHNRLWRELERRRAGGREILDLTISNPTQVGLSYPGEAIRDSLARVEVLAYEPHPLGLPVAREAISGYYHEHGCDVPASNIVLAAGTSEAYGFLLKLLCDPGDEVLIPKPSYPLFDFLAALEGVRGEPYSLSTGIVGPLSESCRAVLAVHPNNPTGIYLTKDDVSHYLERCQKRSDSNAALIVDEVFLDYSLSGRRPRSRAGGGDGLVFIVSGLSKLAALPQVKLSWIAVSGEPTLCREAMERLEHIADTYLSVSASAQHATPRLLELAPAIRSGLRERMAENLAALETECRAVPEVTVPPVEGGWSATLRLPAIAGSEPWAVDFLEETSVYVHPGLYFGFETEACCVVSLIVEPETFREGARRILSRVADRVDSLG